TASGEDRLPRCLKQKLASLLGGPEGGTTGAAPDKTAQLTKLVAGLLCRQQASSLGKDAFLQKYGQQQPLAACVSAVQDQAAQLASGALASCQQTASGEDGLSRCLKQKLASLLGGP